jgi:hypothetical protein
MRLHATASLLEKSLSDVGTLAYFSMTVRDTQSSGNESEVA